MVMQTPELPLRPVLKEYDRIPNADSYRDVKDDLQDENRERIFKRDGYRCVACGWNGLGTDRRAVYKDSLYAKDYTGQRKLHLAHITAAGDFVKNRGKQEDIALSYRDDNLITLCEDCHRCSTWIDRLGGANNPFATKSAWNEKWKVTLERLDDLWKGNPEVREYAHLTDVGRSMSPPEQHRYQKLLDVNEVREYIRLKQHSREQMFLAYDMGEWIRGRVEALFAEAIHVRGWKTPADLIAKLEEPYIKRWMRVGYIPAAECSYPGAEAALARQTAERCVWGDKKCEPEKENCPYCRIWYCAHHMPMHYIAYQRQLK
jgi:5-methylcytosine-specific restriction endonuclease McrA